MLRHFITSCFALTLAIPVQAAGGDLAQARTLIANEQSAEALELLSDLSDSPEKNFWMGRALVEQERYASAVDYLSLVPDDHELYSAAAKAIIYCAWACAELDFIKLVQPFTKANDDKLAHLAQTALLEENLYLDQLPEDAKAQLHQLEQADSLGIISRIAPLFEIDILRLKAQYDEALRLGRQLENNTDLPSSTRHRAKILLARIYYSQAQAVEAKPSTDESDNAKEIEQHADDLRGQGEETLLQFISANPDSNILAEIFQELYRRDAFEDSIYIRPALESWIEPQELIHTKRAAMALRCLYYLDSKRNQQSSGLINTALASCPREEATHNLLLATIRDALNMGNEAQAEQYLKLITNDGVREQFLNAQLLAQRGSFVTALPIFLRCSEQSEGRLHEAALHNAFICALQLDNNSLAIQLLDSAKKTDTKARMLSNRAAFYMQSRPAQSAADARIISEKYTDTPYHIHAQLDIIQQIIPQSLEQAIDRFRQIDISGMAAWSDEDLIRYNAIRIKLSIDAKEQKLEDVLSPIKVVEQALANCQKEAVRSKLIFQYSYYLALEERYEEASNALVDYAKKEQKPELKSQAYLRAGIAEEQLNSIPSLKRAIQLYKKCSEINSKYKTMAALRAASILTRLGQGEESRSILNPLEKQLEQLSTIEQCLLYSALADAWVCLNPEDEVAQAKALECCAQMTALSGLSIRWQNRVLLQKAIFEARFGKAHDSIISYKQIILNSEQLGSINMKGDWYILNSAATGAILELVYIKEFEEALRIAEEMTGKKSNPLTSMFHQWASYIRKAMKIVNLMDESPSE